MARQVAVVIAVQRPVGLPELTATYNDARGIAEWATNCGYEVVPLTDEHEPLTGGDVYTVIRDLVHEQTLDRLLVYFSGHGVSKGVSADYWIMSDGFENPNGPVNVEASLRLARKSGIRHVIVIADACRTVANKNQYGVEGHVIFPNWGTDSTARLDTFFASLSGEAATERIPDEDLLAAYGVHTRCLLSVLRGRVPSALTHYEDHTPHRAVLAFPLAEYLDAAVPDAARHLKPPVKQVPVSIPGSQYPDVLGWVPDSDEGQPEPGRPVVPSFRRAGEALRDVFGQRRATTRPEVGADPSGGVLGSLGIDLTSPNRDLSAALRNVVAENLQRLDERGRAAFETGMGLTVLGAPLVDTAAALYRPPHQEEGAWHVTGSEPGPAVLDLGDARFAASAVLSKFVGTLHVGVAGVDLVSYLPPEHSYLFEPGEEELARENNEHSRRELAVLGAASRLGFLNWSPDDAEAAGLSLRRYKHQNPSYGIFAAYAYERAGNVAAIRHMIEYFERERQEIPYDLTLLADVDPARLAVPVIPSYPLLTQGWALLDPEAAHPAIRAAMSSLAPSVWATPTGDGGRALFNAVQTGELT